MPPYRGSGRLADSFNHSHSFAASPYLSLPLPSSSCLLLAIFCHFHLCSARCLPQAAPVSLVLSPSSCPSLRATKGLCSLLRVPAFTCKEAVIHRAEPAVKHFFSYFHMCWCLGLLRPETSPLRIQTEPKAAPLWAAAGPCTPSASAGREETELNLGTSGAGHQPSAVLQLVFNPPAS